MGHGWTAFSIQFREVGTWYWLQGPFTGSKMGIQSQSVPQNPGHFPNAWVWPCKIPFWKKVRGKEAVPLASVESPQDFLCQLPITKPSPMLEKNE